MCLLPTALDKFFWRSLGRFLAEKGHYPYFFDANDPALATRCDPEFFHSNHSLYTHWFRLEKSNNAPIEKGSYHGSTRRYIPPVPQLSGLLVRTFVHFFHFNEEPSNIATYDLTVPLKLWLYMDPNHTELWTTLIEEEYDKIKIQFFLPDYWMERASREEGGYQNFKDFSQDPKYWLVMFFYSYPLPLTLKRMNVILYSRVLYWSSKFPILRYAVDFFEYFIGRVGEDPPPPRNVSVPRSNFWFNLPTILSPADIFVLGPYELVYHETISNGTGGLTVDRYRQRDVLGMHDLCHVKNPEVQFLSE